MQTEDNKKMTKLEAIIQPSRFEAVKEVLTELGIGGMTMHRRPRSRTAKGTYRNLPRGRRYAPC